MSNSCTVVNFVSFYCLSYMNRDSVVKRKIRVGLLYVVP